MARVGLLCGAALGPYQGLIGSPISPHDTGTLADVLEF